MTFVFTVTTSEVGTGQPLISLRGVLDKLEMARSLDAISNRLSDGVRGLLRGRTADFLHGVWLGHPLHPVLVQIPIGAWASATVLDVLPGTAAGARMLVGVGTATALPAAVAGWNDWASLAREQRRVGLIHASSNGLAVSLQAASFAVRLAGRRKAGSALSLVGLAFAAAGAYLGGHLSYRLAAGVNHAAPLFRRIPDGWHRLCRYDELSEARPVVRTIADVPVLIVREGDVVTAMIERCAHQSGPLSDGEVISVGGATCVVCPWHGSTYRLNDGAVVRGPAATDQPTMRVRVHDNHVEVALP
jgi:nitrite reductase/ring-hydroxylating ferredoxin subunit/uncharacterized membrane protein